MRLYQDKRILLGTALLILFLLGCTCTLPATSSLTSPTATPIPTTVAATATPTLVPIPEVQLDPSRLPQEQTIIELYKRVSPAVV